MTFGGVAASFRLAGVRWGNGQLDGLFFKDRQAIFDGRPIRPRVIAITGSGVPASLNLSRRSSSESAHFLLGLAMSTT